MLISKEKNLRYYLKILLLKGKRKNQNPSLRNNSGKGEMSGLNKYKSFQNNESCLYSIK